MKKFIFLYILLISLINNIQASPNCSLCALITEYEDTHNAPYDPITCFLCKREFTDNTSYDLLKIKEQTFRIHDAESTNCLQIMITTLTNNTLQLCNSCNTIVSELKKELTHNSDNAQENEEEKPSRCFLCCIACCPCILLCYWKHFTCKECPELYVDACKQTCFYKQ